METDRAWIELNLKNLKHNVEQLCSAMPAGCQLMAVVKAEAYGHGAFQVASYLQRIGVTAFAAATIDEAIALRRCGINGEILILGYTSPSRAEDLQRYGLIQTLIGYEYAMALEQQGCAVKVHMKIDTGMHRLGYDAADIGHIRDSFSLSHVQVCGMFTHLCVADSLAEEDVQFTRGQIDAFHDLLRALADMGIHPGKVHIQSSYGLLNYPELKCDYVRAGIALYGAYSSPGDKTRLKLDLRPVLSLRSRVVQIRSVRKGESVGYGRDFVAERDSTIAIIPIGYADGIPRSLSGGKGSVLINGHQALIVGRICMDQLAIDITDVPSVETGAVVTLIGADGDHEITASEVAGCAGSIANELFSRLGHRLPVITCAASAEWAHSY